MSDPLSSIRAGAWVAIDTNILVYANQRRSPECLEFLKRCAGGELQGVVPMPMVAELVHALMLIEPSPEPPASAFTALTICGPDSFPSNPLASQKIQNREISKPFPASIYENSTSLPKRLDGGPRYGYTY